MFVSKTWYALSVLPPPDGWIKAIEKLCLEYLWGGYYDPTSDEMTKKYHKISLAKLRLPMMEGGIEF